MKPTCVIMSAKGEKSFSPAQVKQLRENLDVAFIAVLKPLDTGDFIRLAKDAEILAVTRRSIKDFNCQVIDALPKLKSLAVYSTGYEWVDIAYMREKNITVGFLPDYCTVSVAEHTLALILTMMRRTHMSYDKVRGLIPEDTSLQGSELRDKQVGIIGLGRIGSELANLLKALHTDVCYFDIRDIEKPVVPFKPRPLLLEQSDILVLTCSKKRNASPIIGAEELSKMKKSVFLINPARSDLVDNRAVVDALKAKRLRGYAVDDDIGDYSEELDYGRILQTGHTAWYSTEAIERGTSQWVENIIDLASVRTGNHVNIL